MWAGLSSFGIFVTFINVLHNGMRNYLHIGSKLPEESINYWKSDRIKRAASPHPLVVCGLRWLKATLCPVNTIISILKTFERTRSSTKAGASSVGAVEWRFTLHAALPPIGCNKHVREGAASGEPPRLLSASLFVCQAAEQKVRRIDRRHWASGLYALNYWK